MAFDDEVHQDELEAGQVGDDHRQVFRRADGDAAVLRHILELPRDFLRQGARDRPPGVAGSSPLAVLQPCDLFELPRQVDEPVRRRRSQSRAAARASRGPRPPAFAAAAARTASVPSGWRSSWLTSRLKLSRRRVLRRDAIGELRDEGVDGRLLQDAQGVRDPRGDEKHVGRRRRQTEPDGLVARRTLRGSRRAGGIPQELVHRGLLRMAEQPQLAGLGDDPRIGGQLLDLRRLRRTRRSAESAGECGPGDRSSERCQGARRGRRP